MSVNKLRNAPLKEVIFELHWDSYNDNFGTSFDFGFDLAQGQFAKKLKSDFPLHKKLIPDHIPLKIIGAPLHQYWKSEFIWPVIQHGQCILTINDTDVNYEWIHFKELIISTMNKLIESYDTDLKFNKIKLQYIDAVDLEENEQPINFVQDKLQTKIYSEYALPGKLKSFGLNQIFEIRDSLILNINISNGLNNQNQKKSVIWTTTIENTVSIKIDQISSLIEESHTYCSNYFKTILNPEYYASLDK